MSKAFHRKLCVVLSMTLTVVFSLVSTSDADIKFGKISNEEWQLGAPADYPEANAIVIADEGFIDVNTDRIKIERVRRIKVLTEAGIEEVGEQAIVFDPEYDKIKDFEAHTITPDGKKLKVKDDAVFERVSGDYKEQVFSFPQVSAGCIVEFKYTNISKRFRRLSPWYFQGRLYTLNSRVAVRLEYGFDYNASFRNVPRQLQQPEKKNQVNINDPSNPMAELVTYTWTLSDMPPITSEPYMAAENDYRATLRFQIVSWQNRYNFMSFVTTWEELGDELLNNLNEYMNKKSEVAKLAQEITAGSTSPREQSRALYKYVASQFETSYDYDSWYFVQKNVGELLAEKRGSGEAKNLLLVEMHNALGITAWPILISTRDHGQLDPGNADASQLNYLVAYIEFADDWQVLDASNNLIPYGVVPPMCLVDGALLLRKDNCMLIKLPEMPRKSERTDYTRMIVNGDGPVACSTTCMFTGYYATDFGKLYKEKTPEDFVKDHLAGNLGVSYTLGTYSCVLDTCDKFIATLDFESDELAEQLDANLVVSPVCFAFRSNPFKSEKRFFPVDFMYPFTYHNVVELILPDGATDLQLPENKSLNIEGASFTRSTKVSDSCITVTSTLHVDNPVFLQFRYGELRKFFETFTLCSKDELMCTLGGN